MSGDLEPPSASLGGVPGVDYAFLEYLGVGVDDTVLEANEKRTREYDRQTQSSLEYASEGYDQEWASRPFFAIDWVMENRSEYQRSFEVKRDGETQLAVSIPIDSPLRELFVQARDEVIAAVCASVGRAGPSDCRDMASSAVWVPEVAVIPPKDLHITICIPSLWRRPEADAAAHGAYNEAVALALAEASRGHAAFVVEVDRVALGKDGSLLVLFRTVGAVAAAGATSPSQPDLSAAPPPGEDPLCDRSGGGRDPMTALRADLINVFLARRLAYCQRSDEGPDGALPTGAKPDAGTGSAHHRLLHQATILKTVGGSVHGYIHCSLGRLAIAPRLTSEKVDFHEALRVCRAWSSRLSGRRMRVRGFKLTEMTGTGGGGNKNPFDCAVWEHDILLRAGSAGEARPPASPAACWSFLARLRGT